MILKITKAASKLTSKIVEYLDKEKNEINQATIEARKIQQQLRKDSQNSVLVEQYSKNKAFIQQKTNEWQTRTGSGFRVSGFLRTELMQSGYNDLSKARQFDVVLGLWNKKLEVQNRKDTHIGVRRLILSPDPKDLLGLSDEEKKTILERTVDDSMHKFRERYFEKGDQLSYLSAIHLDTQTTHAHIYIFPYSKNGHYVSMNADKYLRKEQAEKLGMDRLRAKFASENKLDKLTILAGNSFIKERNRMLSQKLIAPSVHLQEFRAKIQKIRPLIQRRGAISDKKIVRQFSGEDAYIKTWDEVWR